jgi:hypothetical protein
VCSSDLPPPTTLPFYFWHSLTGALYIQDTSSLATMPQV